jgi:lysophospholipase L1-like esterase
VKSTRLAVVVLLVHALPGPAFPTPRPTDEKAGAALPGTVPAAKTDKWLERHQGFLAEARAGGIDVLFLGDSITDGWRSGGRAVWDERFAPLKAANFGLSGDRTQHLLWRLQNGELDGIRPRAVVLMIGTNNVGQKKDPEPAASASAGVGAVVAEIRKRQPQARVLLLGVFPRGERPDDPLRGQVREINEAIRRLDDGGRAVRYLDIGAAFLQPDGTISREIMGDFLHLTPRGYAIWADAIREPLARLLK